MKKANPLFSTLTLMFKSSSAATITMSVCLLMLSNFIFGQANMKLQQIKPKWKLGDQKMVHSESFTKIFVKDSLLNNTEASSNYSIKVIDTVKNYTFLFSNEPSSIEIETKSTIPEADSAVNIFAEIIKQIEKETSSFKYELIVDKNTGQALSVKNSDRFLKMIEQVTSTMIDKLGEKRKKSNIQIDSMQKQVNTYFKLEEAKILETIINQFNYIMQPYSYEFPYNSTISQKTMVHDVNALGTFGGIEMPAVLTISSKQQSSSLTIKSDTDYDKPFLLELIKKKNKNMSDLTTSDIDLSEKVETIFITKSSWIASHKSDVFLTMKEVKVINQTRVIFQ